MKKCIHIFHVFWDFDFEGMLGGFREGLGRALGLFGASFGLSLVSFRRSWVSLGRFLGVQNRFLGVQNQTFEKHGSKMNSKGPFGSILGGFRQVLGGFWEESGRIWEDLGSFSAGRGQILDREGAGGVSAKRLSIRPPPGRRRVKSVPAVRPNRRRSLSGVRGDRRSRSDGSVSVQFPFSFRSVLASRRSQNLIFRNFFQFFCIFGRILHHLAFLG